MKIAVVTPARPAARSGNLNTALRWAQLLRELGHRVRVQQSWDGKGADALLALHARRSHESIARFARAMPSKPLIVALTGTDLYQDIREDRSAQASLELATRLVVLQERGANELVSRLRRKTHVIYQSARSVGRVLPLKSCFEVCVSGHLRDVKDPFRAAAALQYLPAGSRICVNHVGNALEPSMAREARSWMRREARYRWLGELPHAAALRNLARSRLMVISSVMEGGANVVAEATVAGVPTLASRISGNVGMLGADYAGYFPFGNERALAKLLWRAESSLEFYRLLKRQCADRRGYFTRNREKASLRALMREFVG